MRSGTRVHALAHASERVCEASKMPNPPPTLKKFQGRGSNTPSELVCEKNSPMKILGKQKGETMPAHAKVTEQTSKHWTAEELEARKKAEEETLPNRETVKLKMPKYVRSDLRAKKYWNDTVKRMEGITLLDDLDTEALGVLCSQLSRRDSLSELVQKMLKDADEENDLEKRLETVAKLDALNSKLISLEKAILQAQTALGLTPSGRVRLMRKRAEARLVEEADELFGD